MVIAVVVRSIALVAPPRPSMRSTRGRVSHRLLSASRWPKGISGATAWNISAAAPWMPPGIGFWSSRTSAALSMPMALLPAAGGIDECPGAAVAVSLSVTEPFSASAISASGLATPGSTPSVTARPSSSTKSSRTPRCCRSATAATAPSRPPTSSSWP